MMKFKHIYVTESNRFRKDFLEAIIKQNSVERMITVLNKNPHDIVESDLKHGKVKTHLLYNKKKSLRMLHYFCRLMLFLVNVHLPIVYYHGKIYTF